MTTRKLEEKLVQNLTSNHSLAAAITREASKQTYYTIRFLVDRKWVEDAFRAYAYFRWLDDILDEGEIPTRRKSAIINRQKHIIEACYRGNPSSDLCVEERMLADLVHNDDGRNPGLQSYLTNMMAVLEFDADREGRLISQAELDKYSRSLSVAVTDAMHYFIGHDDPLPEDKAGYAAVNAAHIVHMLRDTQEDNQLGYFNIPREYLQEHEISPKDVDSQAYQEWVCSRVKLARELFKQGRISLAQIKNFRCRLVGFAYSARFEWMLRTIERDNYCLRSEYEVRKSLSAGLWMVWHTLTSVLVSPWIRARNGSAAANPLQ